MTDPRLQPEWFDRWWQPSDFVTWFKAYKRQHSPNFEMMYRGEPEFKKLREALVAGWFAEALSRDRSVSIKLEAGDFPDFYVRMKEQVWQFEQTEAYPAGRKRGDEYRQEAKRKTDGSPPKVEMRDPGEDENAAMGAIEQAIKDKAERRYSPAPHLLVYVNFGCDGDKPPITNLFADQLARQWSKDLQSCWLLWHRHVVRLWPRPALMRAAA